jgi:hypothetical protein
MNEMGIKNRLLLFYFIVSSGTEWTEWVGLQVIAEGTKIQ